ncbi:MAG: PAS domain S-box protein [Candidatus Hodarchaeota archaeon]
MASISEANYNVGHILTENLDDLIYILNDNFECEYINDEVHFELLGYTSISKNISDFVHYGDLKKTIKFLNRTLKTGRALEQIRIRTRNNYSYFEVKGKRFLDDDNNTKILLIVRDISYFKDLESNWLEKETKLRELAETLPEIRFWKLLQPESGKSAFHKTREMLDIVIDNIPHLIYWKDTDLNYLGCNRNYALENNIEDPNFIVGKKDIEMPWLKGNVNLIQEKEFRVIRKDKAENVIELLNLFDGKESWFEINRIPLHSVKGDVVAVLVIYNNITERKIAEKKIKESEKKYRSILESIREGYFEVDLEGNFIFFNDSLSEITGYPKNELLGKNYTEMTDKENKQRIYQLYSDVYKTGESQSSIQFEFYKKNGIKVIAESSVNLKYDTQGKKIGFFGIVRDITEKFNLEEKLKESEEKYRLISENAYDLISILNQELKFEYINENPLLITLGYTKDEIIGKSVLNFVHPDDKKIAIKSLIGGLEKGEGVLELRIQHKNGQDIWIEVKGKTFLDKDGKVKGITIGRDITKRKEIEQQILESEEKLRVLNRELENLVLERTKELKESEERYRHLYNDSPYSIALLNLEGEIIDINSTTTTLFGYDKEDLIGKNYQDLFSLYPEATKAALREIPDLLSRKPQMEPVVKPQIIKIYNKEGKSLWVESQISTIKLGKENIIQLITQDVTEKKHAEEKLKESEQILRQQNIELKELDRLKTDFISIAAHELKTPLISVGGYVDLILMREKENLSKDIVEDLNRVLGNVRRLEEYVNRLMDVMKIDAKKMELVLQEESLFNIIKDSIKGLDFQISQKRLTVNLSIDKNFILEADSFRISQAFSNILSNAIKFSPEEGIIEIIANKENNNYLVKVRDYGEGLTEEEIKKLFGKFVSLGKSAENFSTFEKGSGLGLYIARGIIEAHGGKIWVDSEGKGKGAEFIFLLPINR